MTSARIPLACLGLALAGLTVLGVRAIVHDDTTPEAQTWALASVEGRDLVIDVSHGVCEDFDRIDVQETQAQVAIAVIHRVYDGDCVAMAESSCHRVTLQAPLATRSLAYAPPLPSFYRPNATTPSESPGARDGTGDRPAC